MKGSKLLLASLCVQLCACSSITFVQVEQEGEQAIHDRWHHTTLNGMVEISKPLDIRDVCGNKAWTQITTELTPYNFMAGVLVPSVPFVVSYSPWTNRVQCHEAVVKK
jgi:hypothetical protein